MLLQVCANGFLYVSFQFGFDSLVDFAVEVVLRRKCLRFRAIALDGDVVEETFHQSLQRRVGLRGFFLYVCVSLQWFQIFIC